LDEKQRGQGALALVYECVRKTRWKTLVPRPSSGSPSALLIHFISMSWAHNTNPTDMKRRLPISISAR
jgi:hypothetical protein